MPGILIERGTLVSHDGSRLSETAGWLHIQGDRTAALGPGDAPDEVRGLAERVIDAQHMALLPGLVNGHTHLSQTFMRGLADGRPLLRWLREVIWPLQDAMTPEDMYLAAMLGLVENLRCGATTVVQHHKLPGRDHVEAVAQAAAAVGIRLVLARGWADMGTSGEPLDRVLAELTWLFTTQHGRAGSRIRVASGPLVPWRCSDEAMRATSALARSWGAPIHIHVSETQDEVDIMFGRCGKRHIEWLADLGVLRSDLQLVHAVHVSETEMDLIAQAQATVVHCPTSNMVLASGAAPVRKMLDRGIPVALGTDGSGSNDSQDLLECAKVAALLAKHAAGDAQALLAADILRMVTLSGARLWNGGMSEGLGQLAPGAPADVVMVNLDNARCQPVHSVASALVYNAGGCDVHTVIVDGRILVDAGQLVGLDACTWGTGEAELLAASRHAARDLMRRAGITLPGPD